MKIEDYIYWKFKKTNQLAYMKKMYGIIKTLYLRTQTMKRDWIL